MTPVLAALEVTSGLGLVISILLMGMLFLFWVISLFLVVSDSISAGMKIVWFIVLTCFAPIAIPLYFLARARRTPPAAAAQ